MKWLIRSEEYSITPFGHYPGARPLEEHIQNGMIILDKPSGPTSHQVDAWIKKILNINKCSHGGTLDPRASGVLVIVLVNATKLMPIILSSDKEYVALIYLHKDVPRREIEKVLKEFVGKIKQIPPKKSAVARRERVREIYYLEILDIEKREILIKVGCEAGTYIRRLADDVGKKLGTGAHLQESRRTKSGNFSEDRVVTIQDIMDAKEENKLKDVILPMELIIESIGKVIVKDSAIANICNGAPLAVGGIVRIEEEIEDGDWVAMLSLKGELISLGKALMNSKEMMGRRGIAVKTDSVLMKKGIYPKI